MKHDLWKKGVYCKKCQKPFFTKKYWLLWLWTIKHLCFCYHLIGVDATSILLINHDCEKVIDGRVEWIKEETTEP